MFIDNKYTRTYYKIIENSKPQRDLPLIEKHHIIPRSFGGSDEIYNIAVLSPKEHYVCHRLLIKMCKTAKQRNKMKYALWCMVNGAGHQPRVCPTGTVYQKIRESVSKVRSQKMQGENNPFYGKKHSPERIKWFTDNNPAKRPEVQAKMRGKRPHVKPHNYYTGWDENTKKKISDSLKGHKISDDTRKKLKDAHKDLVWVYKDGMKPKQIHKPELKIYLEEGWVRGRGPKKYW